MDITGDTRLQLATLHWNRVDPELAAYYNVYRRNVTANTVIARLNDHPVSDTLNADWSCIQDHTYEYRVAAVDRDESEGIKSEPRSVEFTATLTPAQRHDPHHTEHRGHAVSVSITRPQRFDFI